MIAMWSLIRHNVVALLACAVLLLACGCSKDAQPKPSDATRARDGASAAGDALAAPADAADVEVVEDMPESAFNQLKDMWALQVSAPVVQAETLRQIAAEHDDAQLNDLVAQLDKKNAAIKTMFEGASYPGGARTLQVDVPKAVGEANELVSKANLRLQEIVRASIPAPVTGGG